MQVLVSPFKNCNPFLFSIQIHTHSSPVFDKYVSYFSDKFVSVLKNQICRLEASH